MQGKGGSFSTSTPLWGLGSPVPLGDGEFAETRGWVGEARGGPWLSSAAGWMEFTGCGEAYGQDPELEPCASISNAPAFALVPRSLTHHSRACPGVTSQRGTPGTAASPSRSPSPLPCAFPGAQLGPHSLCLPWPAAGQGHSAGSRPRPRGCGVRRSKSAARKRRSVRAGRGRS